MLKKKWDMLILNDFLVSPLLSPQKIKKENYGIDIILKSLYNNPLE